MARAGQGVLRGEGSDWKEWLKKSQCRVQIVHIQSFDLYSNRTPSSRYRLRCPNTLHQYCLLPHWQSSCLCCPPGPGNQHASSADLVDSKFLLKSLDQYRDQGKPGDRGHHYKLCLAVYLNTGEPVVWPRPPTMCRQQSSSRPPDLLLLRLPISSRLLLVSAVILLATVTRTNCSGVFQLQIESVRNVRGETTTGHCCDGGDVTPLGCSDQCETYIQVCLKEFMDRVSMEGSCTFGNATTGVLGGNEFDYSPDTPETRIELPFDFAWLATSFLKVTEKEACLLFADVIDDDTEFPKEPRDLLHESNSRQ
ncbi:hypothetical protein RRG08_033685 [Elysia crispata]|uniref:Notch ligand N-terminal domain-containing protein n=1 Tax=Elysia crispata TaxID=231223 RepID=A0AAE1A8S8_9GAST|nr:hypothetical protein RRG08_033685 [Elysia crispata]